MDGAFVGYHNTIENFGFEYIQMEDIEKRLFGCTQRASLIFSTSTKLIEHVLNTILPEIQDVPYDYVKLGYYSDAHTGRLVVMIEYMNQPLEELKKIEIMPEDGMENIVDYYEKNVGRKNLKVRRFDFKFYFKLNNVYNPFFFNDYEEGDLVQIESSHQDCGYISFDEYMHFLLNAYKYEFIMLDSKYTGNWFNSEKSFCF